MSLTLDISPDELPIYLDEFDEHLQTLDDILIQLERCTETPICCRLLFGPPIP